MNKTILVAGVTAVVSLAAGTAGGYLLARMRFDEELPEIIERETEALKKLHAIALMEARSGKPASPADIPKQKGMAGTENNARSSHPEEDDASDEPTELTPRDLAAQAKGRKTLAEAARAMTDYNGISTAAVASSAPVKTSNIFVEDAKQTKKKELPPRDDSGHFRKRTPREQQSDPPQIIEAETFLQNDDDLEQESLLYFIHDKTLVLAADPNESIDLARVGEVNLTLFPETSDDEPSMIYVHNSGLEILYEIKLMQESLTEFLGLGENSDDDDELRYL